jgi:hypothetical protein
MSHHNLQKPLQPPPSLLNHTVVEAVQVYFSGQGGDRNSSALALQQVPKDFKVRVAPPHFGAAQLEGRDVGGQADQVGCVARGGRGGWLVGLGVCYLLVLNVSEVVWWMGLCRVGLILWQSSKSSCLVCMYASLPRICASKSNCSRAPPPSMVLQTYLNLQEILRDPVYLLEALRVRVGACAREARGHELLRLALALLLLLGLRLLRLLLRLVGAAL